ncbi:MULTISPECIES: DUF475 domain-containing protein [Acinetobacter]|uniref:DUF475 domain-containing protein n=1 Tax=Acinetobacter indicus TaxID=756892 RepID=A0A6C0YRV5_9GAMM|nr:MULTISPECIES: DUF475 domain-containing protein [Acinetobacter]MDM1292524.1 DUF475 domain-containing protein [Acinetobacter indicus]MDM1322556.1 DUF475 domain-containing protein [Acinetobacter indicus]MDM1334286.1 DUF475 domain-containing protein [Acinetobacter indicus]QFS16901.1 DUF475 domain-containing protein [Acinetobacter indicus]QIC70683.1 DUF475 domain-containing protein [Acinetobacter indicus]
MKHFRFSIIFTVICLAISAYWGYTHGVNAGISTMLKTLAITAILAVMEVSLSFDNAVVNASVLRNWDHFWRTIFLTVGILIAVFGMRLVFPLLIVGVTADMGMIEVAKLALNDPAAYSAKLMAHHAEIAAFGGAFLLLVFLNFLFDDEKDTHWFHWLENKLTDLASVPAMSVFLTLIAILVMAAAVPDQSRLIVVMAGIWGIVVYVGVQVIGHLLEGKDDEDEEESESTPSNTKSNIVKAGIGGFLYLEVLDASFSFDGVIGAFAITSDVVIIMLGLAIGAMFVRSMTIYLVEKGTLEAYIYLEHGAHYAIGALALIMLASGTGVHVPELVTGLIGIVLIVWAVMSSIAYSKRNAELS